MKKHILLVDDDEDEVADFLYALNKVGSHHKCTLARSGEQAIKQLTYLTPDIIFLDINMPGMNGLECLASLRRLPHLRYVPVILHSSALTDCCREQAMALGATACLVKPDTLAGLVEIFATLIPGEPVGSE
jgi:CheY-like chemotaxis protein